MKSWHQSLIGSWCTALAGRLPGEASSTTEVGEALVPLGMELWRRYCFAAAPFHQAQSMSQEFQVDTEMDEEYVQLQANHQILLKLNEEKLKNILEEVGKDEP